MRRKIIILLGIVSVTLIVVVFVWTRGSDGTQKPVTKQDSESSTETSTQTLTATEALEKVIGSDRVSGARYFANDTWLVGAMNSGADGAIEIYTVVAKLVNKQWTAVEIGTFIDTEQLLLDGAPPDVIAYLKEVQ